MLRATEHLRTLHIERPTLLLDAERVRANIARMAQKVSEAGVRFRPHFKTHQSAALGEWFHEVGVRAITVSSLDMARYFASHGWSDITVAFPFNVREVDAANALAQRVRLHLLVDSHAAAAHLESGAQHDIDVWIKVDVGGRRAGIPWTDLDGLVSLAQRLRDHARLRFAGLLTHAGHSYDASSVEEIRAIHGATLVRMFQLRARLADVNVPAEVSIGDTPCCSVVTDFAGVDEVRPGNFVFYDLTQAQLGACGAEDIAVCVACPVVGKHAERREIVLYGGAVHLSKDTLQVDGKTIFGYLARWNATTWERAETRAPLVSLSQEHGLVHLDAELFDTLEVGDLVGVVPVHSCLTTDLYAEYRGLDGSRFARRRSNDPAADL